MKKGPHKPKKSETHPLPLAEDSGPPARARWADIARGLGMCLVVLGHFVETAVGRGAPGAFAVYKLIYSFHVPLFFVLAGLTAGMSHRRDGVDIPRRFGRRVVPFVFFNLVGLLLFLAQEALSGSSIAWGDYVLGAASLLRGWPSFNMVTWFLVCLAVTEVLGTLLLRHLPGRGMASLIAAVVCFAVGLAASTHAELVSSITGVSFNFWFVHEALVMLLFYIAGALLSERLRHPDALPAAALLVAVAASAMVVAGTFAQNNGPFDAVRAQLAAGPVVVIGASSHGHPLWFLLTASAGASAVVALSLWLGPRNWTWPIVRPLAFVGRHSLAYLGLAGIALHFVNEPLAGALGSLLGRGVGSMLLACLGQTLLVLTVSAPLVWLLRARAPRLLGIRGGS